jgi:hypothetical protein
MLAQGGHNLQMMLMIRFCKFAKNKTMNYDMQVSVGKAGHVKQNLADG